MGCRRTYILNKYLLAKGCDIFLTYINASLDKGKGCPPEGDINIHLIWKKSKKCIHKKLLTITIDYQIYNKKFSL